MLEKIYTSWKYQTGRVLPRIEEDGGSWMRRHKLYKRDVEPHKKNPETTYLNFMFKFPTDIPNNNCISFSATLLL
jgi:hypothetical protein